LGREAAAAYSPTQQHDADLQAYLGAERLLRFLCTHDVMMTRYAYQRQALGLKLSLGLDVNR
jgi:hypothetical protein